MHTGLEVIMTWLAHHQLHRRRRRLSDLDVAVDVECVAIKLDGDHKSLVSPDAHQHMWIEVQLRSPVDALLQAQAPPYLWRGWIRAMATYSASKASNFNHPIGCRLSFNQG